MTPVVSSIFFDVLAVVGQYLVAAYLGVRSVVLCAGPWVSGRMCVVPVLWGRLYIRNIYTVYLYIYQFTWRYRRYLRVFTGTYFGTYR
jgi:hypothetical protein